MYIFVILRKLIDSVNKQITKFKNCLIYWAYELIWKSREWQSQIKVNFSIDVMFLPLMISPIYFSQASFCQSRNIQKSSCLAAVWGNTFFWPNSEDYRFNRLFNRYFGKSYLLRIWTSALKYTFHSHTEIFGSTWSHGVVLMHFIISFCLITWWVLFQGTKFAC